jgi:streptogramin lyase
LAEAADGSWYVADFQDWTPSSVWRVYPNGSAIAVASNLLGPAGVGILPDGSVVFAEMLRDKIWRLDPSNGTVTLFAGTGSQTWGGDGGPATSASFDQPKGVVVGPDGSVYITENAAVRRVGPDGIISTVAGDGNINKGFSGDGGPALQAKFNYVHDVALLPDGGFVVSHC